MWSTVILRQMDSCEPELVIRKVSIMRIGCRIWDNVITRLFTRYGKFPPVWYYQLLQRREICQITVKWITEWLITDSAPSSSIVDHISTVMIRLSTRYGLSPPVWYYQSFDTASWYPLWIEPPSMVPGVGPRGGVGIAASFISSWYPLWIEPPSMVPGVCGIVMYKGRTSIGIWGGVWLFICLSHLMDISHIATSFSIWSTIRSAYHIGVFDSLLGILGLSRRPSSYLDYSVTWKWVLYDSSGKLLYAIGGYIWICGCLLSTPLPGLWGPRGQWGLVC